MFQLQLEEVSKQESCSHPLFLSLGYWKSASIFSDQIDPIQVKKENCDYHLIRCLECGAFLGIDRLKIKYPRKNWDHIWYGKKLTVLHLLPNDYQSSLSYEVVKSVYDQIPLQNSYPLKQALQETLQMREDLKKQSALSEKKLTKHKKKKRH